MHCYLQVLLSLVGIPGDIIVDRGHCFELEENLPFLVHSDEVGASIFCELLWYNTVEPC